MQRITIILLFIIMFSFDVLVAEAGNRKSREESIPNSQMKQILIIGLNDNIKSNYFYKDMIAEQLKINGDSLNSEYNNVIADNISATSTNGKYQFVDKLPLQDHPIVSKIKMEGNDEESYSNLSSLPTSDLQEMLNNTGADYLLVINQHYLKWQETPLRTIFHIVSYSLFDKTKKEICRGNNYFTYMTLQNGEQIKKNSRKCSSKIADSISKALEKD